MCQVLDHPALVIQLFLEATTLTLEHVFFDSSIDQVASFVVPVAFVARDGLYMRHDRVGGLQAGEDKRDGRLVFDWLEE